MPDVKQFKVLLPTDVKRWLAIQAATNLRSQNSEVVLALREKMQRLENEKSGTTA